MNSHKDKRIFELTLLISSLSESPLKISLQQYCYYLEWSEELQSLITNYAKVDLNGQEQSRQV